MAGGGSEEAIVSLEEAMAQGDQFAAAILSNFDTSPLQVRELVFDGLAVDSLAPYISQLERFVNVRAVSLNGCGLRTLQGFPSLPNLTRLELCHNELTDDTPARHPVGCLIDAGIFDLQDSPRQQQAQPDR